MFVPLKRSFDTLANEIRNRQQLNRTQKVASTAWEDAFGRTRSGEARSFVDFLDVKDRDGKLALTIRWPSGLTSSPLTAPP